MGAAEPGETAIRTAAALYWVRIALPLGEITYQTP